MIGQTKLHSVLEAIANIFVGMGVAYTAQIIVFPWFGIQIDVQAHLLITCIFTAVSFARSYLLRRIGNYITVRLYNGKPRQ